MLDSTGRLSIAQLALYALFTPLILFCLVKHGKGGLLGWLYLLAFSSLRIAGSTITIKDQTSTTGSSSGASIISSIALSPLLLASFGVLHEASGSFHSSHHRLY